MKEVAVLTKILGFVISAADPTPSFFKSLSKRPTLLNQLIGIAPFLLAQRDAKSQLFVFRMKFNLVFHLWTTSKRMINIELGSK